MLEPIKLGKSILSIQWPDGTWRKLAEFKGLVKIGVPERRKRKSKGYRRHVRHMKRISNAH